MRAAARCALLCLAVVTYVMLVSNFKLQTEIWSRSSLSDFRPSVLLSQWNGGVPAGEGITKSHPMWPFERINKINLSENIKPSSFHFASQDQNNFIFRKMVSGEEVTNQRKILGSIVLLKFSCGRFGNGYPGGNGCCSIKITPAWWAE